MLLKSVSLSVSYSVCPSAHFSVFFVVIVVSC